MKFFHKKYPNRKGKMVMYKYSSFLGSTAQLRPWPPPQNMAEFFGGFSTTFFFIG
jgi:hypothetical protein